jgi:acyl carrier protein
MDHDAIKSALNAIFRQTFVDPSIQIGDATSAEDVAGWDSIAHVNLMMAVEKGFNVSFTIREIRGLKNVSDLISLIEKKLH